MKSNLGGGGIDFDQNNFLSTNLNKNTFIFMRMRLAIIILHTVVQRMILYFFSRFFSINQRSLCSQVMNLPNRVVGFFLNKFIYLFLFIYFWLRWVFLVVPGLLLAVASLVAEHGL